jgi:hypothetical protein
MEFPVLLDFTFERQSSSSSRALVIFLFLDFTTVIFRFLASDVFGLNFAACYSGAGTVPTIVLHWLFLLSAALASSSWQDVLFGPRRLVYLALLLGTVYASLLSALELPACKGLDVSGIDDAFDRVVAAICARPIYFLRVVTVAADWAAVGCLAAAAFSRGAASAEDEALRAPLKGGGGGGGGGGGEPALPPTLLRALSAAYRSAPLRHLAAVASALLTVATLASLLTSVASEVGALDDGGDTAAHFVKPAATALYVGAILACILVSASLLLSVQRAAADAEDLAALPAPARGGGTPAPPAQHPLRSFGLLAVARRESPFTPPAAWAQEGGWATALDPGAFDVRDAYQYVFMMAANSLAVFLVASAVLTLLAFVLLLPFLRDWVKNFAISTLAAWLARSLLRGCGFCGAVRRREGPPPQRQELHQPRLFLLLDALYTVSLGGVVGSLVGFSRVFVSILAALFDASQVCRPVWPLQFALYDSAFAAYGATQALAMLRKGGAAADADAAGGGTAPAGERRPGLQWRKSYQAEADEAAAAPAEERRPSFQWKKSYQAGVESV